MKTETCNINRFSKTEKSIDNRAIIIKLVFLGVPAKKIASQFL
jgi:hypothetical protein